MKSKKLCEKTIPKTIPKALFMICKTLESAYLSKIAEFEQVDTSTLRGACNIHFTMGTII